MIGRRVSGATIRALVIILLSSAVLFSSSVILSALWDAVWRPPEAPSLPAEAPSQTWEWLESLTAVRRIRHTATGRCFLVYVQGGIVETAPEVCR